MPLTTWRIPRRLQIAWDRMRKDVFVSTPRFSKGTKVIFEIRRNSRLRLEDVFAEFAPQSYDFQFEKTRVAVKLLQHDYLSRSEAKRILFRNGISEFQTSPATTGESTPQSV